MTIRELLDKEMFEVVNKGEALDVEISQVFCCDLLSVAMGKAPEAGAWITVMGNMNTLAVASLTEVGCIILAEGAYLDDGASGKARQEGLTVFRTELSIFGAAMAVHEIL